ncbi:UNVERIFIED_CONTAM: PH, RCC1 and FYVE domains-containing protein 1 [Sesamum latifolium]|uniref:PH, RCC1 and FYVE domains-containing protein 1 n=1 Tax=Sesamum latifolium TaxID=2727402 RepID=A0AAW2T8C0_9LAMI
MSRTYDNWERLVAAVLKREQIWQLCHAPSRSSSFSSLSSDVDPSSSFRFDENSKLSEIKHEWVEKYEEGVYFTLEASGDGSINVKRVRFSRRKFNEEAAETWWLSNRDKVYERYNHLWGLARLRQFSISGQAGSASNVPVPDKSEENSELGEPGRDEQPLTLSTFNENMKSRNSEVKGTASQIVDEWMIDTYEPGVRVILRAFRDGSRDIIQIQFRLRELHTRRGHIESVIEEKGLDIDLGTQRGRAWPVTRPSVPGQASSGPKEQFPRRRYENNPSSSPDELLLALGRTQEPMLETNFDEILKSANLDGPLATVSQPDECELIQRYEPGVYVTLVCLKDGSTDVERVRFSRRIFETQEAEAWWIKNREQVYYRYNARAGLSRMQLLQAPDNRRQTGLKEIFLRISKIAGPVNFLQH